MVLARQEVQEAEQRIHTLEAKLQHMSELVREDQLTGSLNRRGLDDVFERETARRPPRHAAVHRRARPGRFQAPQRHLRPPSPATAPSSTWSRSSRTRCARWT
jgi:uncharacterized coiled-coil protein SlyX